MDRQSKTKQEVGAVRAAIQKVSSKNLSEAQQLAVVFACKILGNVEAVSLLIESEHTVEAHAVFRLMLENLFNLGALLHNEKHLDALKEHAVGEPARQIKKIFDQHQAQPTLTEENAQKAAQFLDDATRKDYPKTGLNWEQIARAGKTDGLYVVYKQYSLTRSHSTLMSLAKEVSEDEVAALIRNTVTVLQFVCALLLEKTGNVTPPESPKPQI
jgi:hypothetical protein